MVAAVGIQEEETNTSNTYVQTTAMDVAFIDAFVVMRSIRCTRTKLTSVGAVSGREEGQRNNPQEDGKYRIRKRNEPPTGLNHIRTC